MRWAPRCLIKFNLKMMRKSNLRNSFNSQILHPFQMQIQKIIQEPIQMKNLKILSMMNRKKNYYCDQEQAKEAGTIYNLSKSHSKVMQNKISN